MDIAEILFHEIADGDVRKFNAESNDADTGGGARDLRFSLRFEAVLDRFFPQDAIKEGRKSYRLGDFVYKDTDGQMKVQRNIHYDFQPTNARPNELRICQLSKVPFFQQLPELQPGDGRLFVAFIRMTEGLPQMQFLTERQILDKNSNALIAAEMRDAIEHTRKGNSVVVAVEMI